MEIEMHKEGFMCTNDFVYCNEFYPGNVMPITLYMKAVCDKETYLIAVDKNGEIYINSRYVTDTIKDDIEYILHERG